MAVVCSRSRSGGHRPHAAATNTVARAASDAPGSCSAAGYHAQVSWAEEPGDSICYVQLTDPSVPGSRPYALQTTSITLVDLVPDTEYALSVYTQPSSISSGVATQRSSANKRGASRRAESAAACRRQPA